MMDTKLCMDFTNFLGHELKIEPSSLNPKPAQPETPNCNKKTSSAFSSPEEKPSFGNEAKIQEESFKAKEEKDQIKKEDGLKKKIKPKKFREDSAKKTNSESSISKESTPNIKNQATKEKKDSHLTEKLREFRGSKDGGKENKVTYTRQLHN